MVKLKEGVVWGRNCRFDVGSIRMTKRFVGALKTLDSQCMPGATWDISKSGRTWVAEPCAGPFEPIVFKYGKGWFNIYG